MFHREIDWEGKYRTQEAIWIQDENDLIAARKEIKDLRREIEDIRHQNTYEVKMTDVAIAPWDGMKVMPIDSRGAGRETCLCDGDTLRLNWNKGARRILGLVVE
jgi:pullulanase/glycogen debranching enzyme